MPHFTIEYSANLDERLDMAEVVDVVRKAAVETGIFPLGGIRVRAARTMQSRTAGQLTVFSIWCCGLRCRRSQTTQSLELLMRNCAA